MLFKVIWLIPFQLVTAITLNALELVQDPYGNYVCQYVIDLSGGVFAEAVIQRFYGHICALSVQKFSSNVVEKVWELLCALCLTVIAVHSSFQRRDTPTCPG